MVGLTREVTPLSTFDASLDYWSTSSTRSEVQSAPEEDIEDSNDIYGLEEVRFVHPSAISRFRERHQSFILFLLANILLAPLLAYAGLQIVASHPPIVSNTIMMSSGVKSMTSTDLVSFARLEHVDAYWLSSVPGDKYTINNAQGGINSITYIPAGVDQSTSSQATMSIMTYSNSALYSSQLKPLSNANATGTVTQNGVIVQYDSSAPNHMVVTFSNHPEIVVVDYPTTQTPASFIHDAESLTRI